MKLVVGLGNPGRSYRRNRHNVGLVVLEHLAREQGLSFTHRRFKSRYTEGEISGEQVLLARPQTYMNVSGEAVGPMVGHFKLDPADLIVIHDDIDLPFGVLRVKSGGGDGGHKGVRSLVNCLGSGDFIRVRVGVGRPRDSMSVTDHVLDDFSEEENQHLAQLITTAARAVTTIISDGVARAMNDFNAATPPAAPDKKEQGE